MIYLGDHVRARVALPGNDDFTVKRPIDEAHRLPAIGAARSSSRGRPSTAGRSRGKTPTVQRSRGGSHASETSSKLGALAPCAAALAAAGASARDLTVVSWGGAYQDAQREVYFKPFMAKTGIKMAEESWDGGVGTLRAKVQGGNNNWDVVQVESEELLLGCEEGLYEKLDWAKLGGKDKYHARRGQRLRRRRDRLQLRPRLRRRQDQGDAPKIWADFWNVQKYPGKRALRKGPKTTLEIALMADGVAPKDVYKTLGTDAGVERAFKKLDQLKPQHGLVGEGLAAAAAARVGRSGDDRRLQRPHRRRERRRTRRTSRSSGRTTSTRSTRG